MSTRTHRWISVRDELGSGHHISTGSTPVFQCLNCRKIGEVIGGTLHPSETLQRERCMTVEETRLSELQRARSARIAREKAEQELRLCQHELALLSLK